LNIPLHNLLRFQLAHATWALRSILDAAAKLPAPALEQELGIGPGPLRVNIAHTIEVMFFFADNVAGREYVEPPHLAQQSSTVQGLRDLLSEADAHLRASLLNASERGFGAQVHWPNAEQGSLPTEAAIAQIVDHAALHRTQCINMLKRLGVRPVPDLDPMTFAASGESW